MVEGRLYNLNSIPSDCATLSFCFRKFIDAGSSPTKTAPKKPSGFAADFNRSFISAAMAVPSMIIW